MRKHCSCQVVLLLARLSAMPLVMAAGPVFADHPTVGVQGDPGGPMTTSTAGVLSIGQAAVSVDFQFIDFDPVKDSRLALASERDEGIHSADSLSRSALNFAFGVSDKLTVGLSLPYIERKGLKEAAHGHEDEDHELEVAEEEHHEEELDEEPIEQLGDANGFGDVQVYGAYQFLSAPNNTGSYAFLFGLKIPTGDTRKKSRDGERLETELQPGSGSWDPFLGLAYSHRWEDWSFDSNLLYTFVTEGSQRTNLGDIFNYNLSLSHPIYSTAPAGHEDHDHYHLSLEAGLSVSLSFEINGEWRDRTRISGHTERHSGGNILYFSPGLSVRSGDWTIGASVSVPVENLNGVQSEPETRIMFRLARLIQ